MGLEHLKRWQWALIGLLIGLAFGGSRVYWRDVDPGGPRSFDREQFNDYLSRGMEVRNLVLHPPIHDQEWVTGEAFQFQNGSLTPPPQRRRRWFQAQAATQPSPPPAGKWVAFPMLAAEINSKRPEYDNHNGREFMASLAKDHPKSALSYRFAWWEVPKFMLGVSGAAGVVLIGGIWPILVSLMTGGGFGFARQKQDDLSQFKSEYKSPAAPATSDHSQGDAELAELNAKLEAGVAGMVSGSTTPPIDHDAEEAAVIRDLNALASDPAPATPRKPDESKEYGGEFYPVARPGAKRDDKI